MLYKNKINPLTGEFNLVPSNDVITWKPSVDTEANLPTEGNVQNDARMVNDTQHLYVWDGTSWIDQGDIIDLTWAAISGKPSSLVVNIDDAVDKRHTQNTDVALRTDKLTVDASGNTEIQGSFNLPNDQAIKFGGDILIRRWEANKSIAIGKNAGADKINSVYVGEDAGKSNTKDYVVFVGKGAGELNTGEKVTAIGHGAAGYVSGYSGNTGNYVTAVGIAACMRNTGNNVVGVGLNACHANTGNEVIGIGSFGSYVNAGNYVIGIGRGANAQNSGNYVIGIGYRAGELNTGDNCVFIGYEAGINNTTANQFIIKQANVNANPLMQGDFATGKIGIGIAIPTEKLDIVGNIKLSGYITDGTNNSTPLQIKDAVDKAHIKLHTINDVTNHTGIVGTLDNFMAIDANGLPKDSGKKVVDFVRIEEVKKYYVENDAELTNDTDNWAQKLRISFTPIEVGDYIISWQSEIANSNANKGTKLRVELDDTTELSVSLNAPIVVDGYLTSSGFKKVTFSDTNVHTIDIDFVRESIGIAKIRRARIFVCRHV